MRGQMAVKNLAKIRGRKRSKKSGKMKDKIIL